MAISIKHNKSVASRVGSRQRRQLRGRKKLSGSPERPRLVVTRSSKHIVAQVVNDLEGQPWSASTLEKDLPDDHGDKTAKARKVGELVPSGRKPRHSDRRFDLRRQRYADASRRSADGAREKDWNSDD